MTDNKLLQQDEIDALLKSASGSPDSRPSSQEEDAAINVDGGDNPFDLAQLTDTDTQLIEQEASSAGLAADAVKYEDLKPEEKDALGEIGNISMGSAATTLSQLLNRRVLITSPEIIITSIREFLDGFNVPFLIIKVEFVQGITGHNILMIKLHDAMVLANLMMGGDGTDLPEEISEMEVSAAAEAMNQMIGTASTSLADLMNKSVNIAPPEASVIYESDKMNVELPFGDPIVITSFKMNIEGLLDTRIMQILDLQGARQQARLLLQSFGMLPEEPAAAEESHLEQGFIPESSELFLNDNETSFEEDIFSSATNTNAGTDLDSILDQRFDQYPQQQAPPAPTPTQTTPPPPMPPRYPELEKVDPEKLNMLLDIPLKVSVVLGRTKKSIKDVLSMTPGAIAELETLIDESVDVLVNGKLVAKGEVVVVNENFGVKITNIVSQRERIKTLK